MWAPIEEFFKMETGRLIDKEEVMDIIIRMNVELKNEITEKAPDRDMCKHLVEAMSFKRSGKHSLGDPTLFNDVQIHAEGCIPGIEAAFLATIASSHEW
jgi:hypothetical protein